MSLGQPRVVDDSEQESQVNLVGSVNTEPMQQGYLENIEIRLLEREKERRNLFRIIFGFSILFVFAMVVILGCWLWYATRPYFSFNLPVSLRDSSNIWHIATILIIPPTTILFLLVKVLSQNAENDSRLDEKTTPAGEFLNQLLDILKSWVNKK